MGDRLAVQSFTFTVQPSQVAAGSTLIQFPIPIAPGFVGRVINVFGRATLDPVDVNTPTVVHNMALAHDLSVGLAEAWGVAPDTGANLSYTPGAAGFPAAPVQQVSGDLRNAVFDSETPLVLYYGVGAVGAVLTEPAKFSVVVEVSPSPRG